ncbi:unnamed protein product [Rhizophagus irregularis]|nr:unnamed protein product [Rhizophagus irregularis]
MVSSSTVKHLSKLYRTAYIVFDSASSMDQFGTTWAVFCTGHCLRVCPASHSPDQRAVRRAHVALLAGLPRESVTADLSEIAEEISAKSVNIPFSYNSYNPKLYAYVHFSSAATKESAMGITCALKNIGLTWHEPNEVSSLCHRCGCPGCDPDKCASSHTPQRPSRPWSSNDKLRELYNKHLPPSHPAKRHNHFAWPPNSQQRSYADVAGRRTSSRSCSRYSYSPELTKLIAINKFLDRFLYRLTTHRPNRSTQISQMTVALPSHLANLASLLPDYSVPTYSTTPLSGFKSFLRSQKNLVSAFLSTKFAQQLTESVEYYTALRDEHFSDSPDKFIDSALSVEKRSIVLDRVLVVLDSKPTLLTDPSDIKQAAIAHFQSVVTSPLVHYSSPVSFPPRWQKAYTPISDVSASLYDPVLAPITLLEWSDIILPCLTTKLSDLQKFLMKSVVYPIPKPHDFDAQLKNTRPITLLETVQKCVVKVVTNHLSNILADNNVLQGVNFAGLPGGSTDVPIKMLDAIIHQHKHDSTDDQELWIVSQDISKAFDSMDLNILKLALDRLHIPTLLVQFILNLFTRRNNKIITCHGDTPSYRVRVALLDYSPVEFEQHSLPVSHLTFMDDSTLIASSKSGIEDRLSITAEFYTLNNVQANSAKYVLLSSSYPSSVVTFDLLPSPLVSNVSLSLSSLALGTSFRFLGVWFSLSASSQFVLKQARSMVKDMAALLGLKKLLAQHVAYLYNVVLLLRLEFRLQTTLFSESTIQSIVKPMFSVLKRKAGLATTTPLALLFLKLPFSIQNAFYRFLSSHIASWQKIFIHPDFKDFANYAISYLQGYLGAESCPTAIDLEPWSQIVSLWTHTLYNSLLFSS